MYSEDVPTMKSISISQILVLPDVKVPLKRNFFSRFSIVQNVCNTTAKNILAKKIFVMRLRFKMLHFPPPSGECCSRSKGHVTGPCDVRSCVAIVL